MGQPHLMSRYEHWVVKAALAHNAAIRSAKALDPAKIASGVGRTAAEKEVSDLCCAFYEILHEVAQLVREHGVEEFFGPRSEPLEPPILR